MNPTDSLSGRRLLVTRQKNRGRELTADLRRLGAEVHHIPTIELIPLPIAEVLPELRELQGYDWLLLTSVTAVSVLAALSRKFDIPLSDWPPVCAIGPATAKQLTQLGIEASLQPVDSRAEGVLAAIQQAEGDELEGRRLLLPRAREARPTLPDGLRRLGAAVDVIPLYENQPPYQNSKALRALLDDGIDLVTFTSSSAARHLVELAGEERTAGLKCAVIGPVTASVARNLGFEVAALADRASTEALVTAILRLFQSRR